MVQHPTSDPSLPSYVHPSLRCILDELECIHDCWGNLKDVAEKYVWQEEKEPPKAYQKRLNRTKFDNRFKPAIRGHAGLLSEFTFNNVPASIEASLDDIDLQGTNADTFFITLDEIALRDGGVGVLVESPKEEVDADGVPLIGTMADLLTANIRPYLVRVDRRNIINWRYTIISGKPFIYLLIIRECHEVSDGNYGTINKTFYRVLEPGRFTVYELVEAKNKSGWTPVVVDEGTTALSEIPFAWYSLSSNTPFDKELPFSQLAELNIEHHCRRSSLHECLHKLHLPVPVRKGYATRASNKPGSFSLPPLEIGPNSVVDIPNDGDFFFAEPTGNGVKPGQEEIAKLEAAMDRLSLSFLTGGEGSQRTATEIVMDSAQVQATLKTLSSRKESAIQSIFSLWCQYTGEDPTLTATVNQSMLQVPATPQDVQVILDAMGTKIPNEIGLRMLQAKRWLPPDADIDQMVRLLEGDVANERMIALSAQASIDAEANRLAQIQNGAGVNG